MTETVESGEKSEIGMPETVSDIPASSFEFVSDFGFRHSDFIRSPARSSPGPVFGGLSAKAREQAEIFRRD